MSRRYFIGAPPVIMAVMVMAFAITAVIMSGENTKVDRNGTIAGVKFNEELDALPDTGPMREKLITELLNRERGLFIAIKANGTIHHMSLASLHLYYGIDNACRKFIRGDEPDITVDVMRTERADIAIKTQLEMLGVADVPMVNASLRFEQGMPVPSLGEDGTTYDWNGMLDAIYRATDITINQNTAQSPIDVDRYKTVVKQNISNDDIWRYVDVIGESRTKYSDGSTNRNHNMELACEKLTGAVVMPGRIFSMYNQASPFTVEEGYLTAGSLKDGLANEAIGGGVCQVTTTLYNAVLRAELDVIQRYNHSLKPTYVAPAFDATVSSANVDFKFQNNSTEPVFLYAEAVDGVITVRVFGYENREPDRRIQFDNRYDDLDNIYFLDKSIYVGQELVTVITVNESVYKN